jgi:hypothetical protein
MVQLLFWLWMKRWRTMIRFQFLFGDA